MKVSIHGNSQHLSQMVLQISRTYDFDRNFLEKGAAYLRVFTVLGVHKLVGKVSDVLVGEANILTKEGTKIGLHVPGEAANNIVHWKRPLANLDPAGKNWT